MTNAGLLLFLLVWFLRLDDWHAFQIHTHQMPIHTNTVIGSSSRHKTRTIRPRATVARQLRKRQTRPMNEDTDIDEEDDESEYEQHPKIYYDRSNGQVDQGPNWIQQVQIQQKSSTEDASISYYDLGIDGDSYQVGSLSLRIYNAIVERFTGSNSNNNESPLPPSTTTQSTTTNTIDSELSRACKLYAMEAAAKEAVRVALFEHGLAMAKDNENDEQEQPTYTISRIQLHDNDIDDNICFDDWQDCVDDWTQGQSFSFVAHAVAAQTRDLSRHELLRSLDPNGAYQAQAQRANMTLLLQDDDTDDTNEDSMLPHLTLQDICRENKRRAESAPRGTDNEPFHGNLQKRGYRPIAVKNLLMNSNTNETLQQETLMHVMDSLVSHGCLLVDLTNGGHDHEHASTMMKLWRAAETFFVNVAAMGGNFPSKLDMQIAEQVGSDHAKVGFAGNDNGSMRFLETRLNRHTGAMMPAEACDLLGDHGADAMANTFRLVADIGKCIVRIAVTAANEEVGAFCGRDASLAACRLANELIDNGKSLETDEIQYSEGAVSMSPHRLCKYVNNNNEETSVRLESREVFGAHTDSTFLTVVPVAAVPGLEVYDEAAEQWYRPEMAARKHWQGSLPAKDGIEADALDDTSIPWHARYLIVMPGEVLQVVTCNEIEAAVHRVVATREERLSAPILLRARPGTTLNVTRYFGPDNADSVLDECNGCLLQEIYDRMQL
jgi:hypothetical protein